MSYFLNFARLRVRATAPSADDDARRNYVCFAEKPVVSTSVRLDVAMAVPNVRCHLETAELACRNLGATMSKTIEALSGLEL